MRKACSTKLLLALAAALVGCAGPKGYRKPPVVPVIITGTTPEDRLIVRGFSDQLAEYNIQPVLRQARSGKEMAQMVPDLLKVYPNLIALSSTSPDTESAIVHAFKYSIGTVVIGVTAKNSKAAAVIVADPRELASKVDSAIRSDFPDGARIGFLGGSTLVESDLLDYQLQRQWLPPSPYLYASRKQDAVVALGVEGLREAGRLYPLPTVYLVAGGDEGERALLSGKVAAMVEPLWYAAGVRAARIVRDTADRQDPTAYRFTVPVEIVRPSGIERFRASRVKMPPPDPAQHPMTEKEKERLWGKPKAPR